MSRIAATRIAGSALLATALVGCSTQDNLGNHVFGDARWSLTLGSPGEERATAMATDRVGNVIVAGTCDGVVDFGATRADCRGSFVTVRASDTGREQWTALLAGASVSSLDIDDFGYVIVAGSYTGRANVAGTELSTMGTDSFVAVFESGGAPAGVVALGVVGTAVAPVGTIEPDGCSYVTGGFHGAMPTNDGMMVNTSGELDGYVTTHFAAGDGGWTVKLAGPGNQLGRAVAQWGERLSVVVQSTAPLTIGDTQVDAPAWPASVLAQLSMSGELLWTRPLPESTDHVAIAPTGAIVVTSTESEGAMVDCSRMRAFDRAGTLLWTSACARAQRPIDAFAIGAQGVIVSGGRNLGPDGGELFLDAHDSEGEPIGSIESPAYPFARDSSLGAIAVEPSGEVAFVATVNHPFDFGNGMLPFEGAHDAVVVKLDSPTGHDGPVVLLRE